MVELEGSIVKVDFFMVRLPAPNDDKVNQTQAKHQVKSILGYLLN